MRTRQGSRARGDRPRNDHHDWASETYVDEWVRQQQAEDPSRAERFQLICDLFPFPNDATVTILDVGAGYGPVSLFILDRYPHATCIAQDGSEPMLNRARHLVAKYGERFKLHQSDLFEVSWLPEQFGPFDAAVSSSCLHNLRDFKRIREIYGEIRTHLKPGAAPEGQMTWGVHVSLAPTWFDPAETSANITPWMVLYALHDAVVKSLPGIWQPPLYSYDASRARQLLAEAGYPNGFDAGEFFSDSALNAPEAVVNDLRAVGIRVKFRPLERVAFFRGLAEKKYKNLVHVGSGAFGNAATRIEAFVVAGGSYVDRKKREAILHRIQQLIHDKAMFGPVLEIAFMSGVGPRVEESGLGLITGYAFSAPYEDVKLRVK